jgi:tetratricopeptide (TPR) repeat protein/transcriptional regulator with XRE-family HTH domain
MNAIRTWNEILRHERELRGWSQGEVAEALGTDQKVVSRWERGISRPSPYFRKKLIELFGKNAQELGFLDNETLDDDFIGQEKPVDKQTQLSNIPSQETNAAQLSFWSVPYQRNPFFTGREELLVPLYTALHKTGAVAVTQAHALCGLGGIGKTQIVLEYAYRYRDEYQAVFWVKSDTRENLLSDFLALASLLNLPEQHAQDQASVLAAIQHWMQNQTAWLLILDNADDLTFVKKFIVPGSRGHILLTTHAQALGRLANRLNVDVMNPETGALFLLRRAGLTGPDASLDEASEDERTLAGELVREMGGLPLALDQAGAYMEESSYSLASYLNLYRKERLALLKRRGGIIEDHPEPVAATWSISFDEVERVSRISADLLRLCAFLNPDVIPEELLRKGASVLGPNLAAVGGSDLVLNEAIEDLRRFSLIRRHADFQMLSLHRLVQIVLKETMNPETQRIWVDRAVRAMHLTFPAHVEPRCWEACQRLLPQVQNCSLLIEEWTLRSPEAALLLHQTAYYLRERGGYTEAEALYRQALTIREESVGSGHLDTAQSAYNLARLYVDQGRYVDAEQLYLRSLATRERVHGPEHPAIAQCLNSLALLYWFWGHYEQSEALYLRALPMYQQLLGPEHPDTAHCMNNLALLYVTQAKFAEAERLHQQVLSIRQAVLPSAHPDTAQSLQNLACLFLAQGNPNNYLEAEQLLLQSLAMREQVLGPDHPQTAKSLHNLALLYEAKGNYAEAEQLYQRVLDIRERALGKANPKTLATVEDYAALLRKMQQDDKAVRLQARLMLSEAAP